MKKIMILGAGISQVPLIKKAKEMGHNVIVVSRRGSYPGFALADQIYYVDTTNNERVLEIALKEKIDGICTTGTDVAVKSVGKVADEMQLRGVSYAAALASSNKLWMKQAIIDHGVRTAKFIRVTNKQEAIQALEHLQAPVIFKAVDSGASKGIVKVDNYEQIPYAFDYVMNETKEEFFIVEEFIAGTEFGAQAFIYNNKLEFILPHGDMLFYGDTGVPIGHYAPYNLPNELITDMTVQLENSVKALHLNDCAINADFMLKDNEVYVLEIGARAGATCLPEIVSIYHGFDYYEQMINAALDMPFSLNSIVHQPCACELLISAQSGNIISQENNNSDQEDIIEISFDYGVGDSVRKFNVGTDRIGQLIVKGSTIEKVLTRLDQIKSNIVIKVIEN